MNYNGNILYSKNKNNKVLEWKAFTDFSLNEDQHIEITVVYGQQNGKKITKTRLCKSGKNIGKKNETSIQQQAQVDLNCLYRAQLEEKGYFLNLEDFSVPRTAMLAHKYQDKKHKLMLKEDNMFFSVPYYAQPKLNGIRCTIRKVSEDNIIFLSRTNKTFTPFPHILETVKDYLNVGDIIDGELFNPDIPLEHIASIVNSDSDRYVLDSQTGARLYTETDIQFHMYDAVPNDSFSFTQRLEWLTNWYSNLPAQASVVLVNTVLVQSLDEVRSLFSEWISKGYEGLMLRNGESIYEFNQRSIGLLKYKEMFDEEFQIINIIPSDQEPDQPVFIIKVEDGIECNVRKAGTKEENAQYLLEPNKYIGKWLNVTYQAKTKYNNLSFPIGRYIRDGEVIDGKFVPSS